MTEFPLRCDVVIAGGGMVGAALACALTDVGFRVLLVEQRYPSEDWPAGEIDLRVSAITRASSNLFRHLQAWDAMQRRRVTPYQEMRVWELEGEELHFSAAELGEPELGHIIENRVIQRALWDRLETQQVQLACPDRVAEVDFGARGASVRLQSGRRVEAALLVAADGAGSPLRAMAGIAVRGWGYRQTAVVATVRPQSGHASTAWQRFLPDGPLALLPIDADRFSIVWSTRPEHAAELVAMPAEEFSAALTAASQDRCGHLELVSERAGFPLRLQHAVQYVRPGLALAGDAAHLIHPLAGQGVNLGLLDIAALTEVLQQGRADRRPLGDLTVLRRYERARRGDNLRVQLAMDGIKRLFGTGFGPLPALRSFGMGVLNHSAPLKRQMVRVAMGLTGELPPLAAP